MFPNLMGQQAFHHMTAADMAKVIGVPRTTFQRKMKTGKFGPEECKKFCDFFGKSFDYLFATNEDTH